MDPWQELMKQTYLRAAEALRGGEVIRRVRYTPQTIWDLLATEGNHTLITTLRRVERREAGYGVLITPKEGYSKNPKTHEAVVKWLTTHCESYSPTQEIAELEETLKV